MKQNNDKWEQQLRNRLSDYEVLPPDDLWADIEKKLSDEPAPRRSVIFTKWIRWAAAACLLLVAGGGWLLFDNFSQKDSMSGKPLVAERMSGDRQKNESDADNSISESDVLTSESNSMLASNNKSRTVALPVSSSVSESYAQENENVAMPSVYSENENTNVSEENKTTEEPAINYAELAENQSKGKYDAEKRYSDKAEDIDKFMQATEEEWLMTVGYGQQKEFTVGMSASSGLIAMKDTNPLVLVAPRGMPIDNNNTNGGYDIKQAAPIYSPDFKERYKHYQPVSFGLTVGYPISPRLSINTGLVYTLLTADYTSESPNNSVDGKQTRHYIGIPLNLSWQAWNYGRWSVYATAGGQADYNVSSKFKIAGTNAKIGRDNMQWSLGFGAGLEYRPASWGAVYVEPGARYYIDNRSNANTIFKEKQFNYSVQLGFRLLLK